MASPFNFGGGAAASSSASSPFSFSLSQPAAGSSPAPAFGASPFGASSAAASSAPTFGSSLFGAQSGAASASTAASSPSPFGFGSTAFSFGQPTAPASSGASAPPLSGASPASSAATTPKLFGATGSSAASSPGLFGAAGSATTPSPFGASSSAAATPSLFSATSAAATTPGLFGATSSPATTPSLFGNTSAAGTTPNPFGAAPSAASTPSPFGAATGFGFGTPASGSTATTAAASTPAFAFSLSSGAAASSTASTPASAPALGFGASTGSSLFGSTTSAPLFSSSTASSPAAAATTAPSFGISSSPATTAPTSLFGSSSTTTAANTAPSLFSASSPSAFSFPKSTSATPATTASTPSTGFSLATSQAAPSLFSNASAPGSSTTSTSAFSFGSSAASTPTFASASASATGASTAPSATATSATTGSLFPAASTGAFSFTTVTPSSSSAAAATATTTTVTSATTSAGMTSTAPSTGTTGLFGLPASTSASTSTPALSFGTHHESSLVPDIHVSPARSCDKTIDDTVDFEVSFDAHAKEERISKLQPKVRVKLPKLTAKSGKTNQKVAASTVNVVIESKRSDTDQIGLQDDPVQAPKCHESGGQTSDSKALLGAEPKGKGKSVSFSLPDASEGVAPRDTDSVEFDFDKFCDDLYGLPQKTAEKEHADNLCQYPEGEPSDHAIEQPKLHVGGIGSSMNLRSRKNLQKVGKSQHTAEDYCDDDSVEPSTSEQDNDGSIDYTAGSKRKNKRKSRDGIEEPQQQGVQNDKSQKSSRGRKDISKDAPTEKTEKKLTHRIRQKRMKEVKTLLETPYEEIDHKKLSAAHLRLLQEARERINVKDTLPGPSSNISSQHENMDGFDYDGYDEAENFDDNRAETSEQTATKLNYHSYMNKRTRAKWSKSEIDLFYQGLRQFGSDFAMIQQLFPDKTRHHVRQKFKAEERKNPVLIHDAIIHRSGDNLYFKKVIKQLNIEDMVPDISNTCKQDGASNEDGPANENASDDFVNEEENSSNQLGKEQDMHMSDVQEEDHVPENSDDEELGAIFDWY